MQEDPFSHTLSEANYHLGDVVKATAIDLGDMNFV